MRRQGLLFLRRPPRQVGDDLPCVAVAVFEEDPEAALRSAEEPFDLLLSDLGLPDGSGLDLIRLIRRSSDLPAIAISGYGMEHDRQATLEAGFSTHLTKPIDLHLLRQAIDRTIGNRGGSANHPPPTPAPRETPDADRPLQPVGPDASDSPEDRLQSGQ